MRRAAAGAVLGLALVAGGCSGKEAARPADVERLAGLPQDQQDAEALGRELFDLVDRAIDYRGSHRGRPAASFRQMGVDSLTPSTARYLVNLAREPVVTVSFRRLDTREITSCRGDGQILEEATLNGGRFTVMCTTRSGSQRPMRIGDHAGR
jgi:hypothetical protein